MGYPGARGSIKSNIKSEYSAGYQEHSNDPNLKVLAQSRSEKNIDAIMFNKTNVRVF